MSGWSDACWWIGSLCGLTLSVHIAFAADLELVTALAEFEKNEGAVTSYQVGDKDRILDLHIKPATPLKVAEATVVGRRVCSLGAQELRTKLVESWTVRVFLPEEGAPTFVCAIAAVRGPVPATRRRRSGAPGHREKPPPPHSGEAIRGGH